MIPNPPTNSTFGRNEASKLQEALQNALKNKNFVKLRTK